MSVLGILCWITIDNKNMEKIWKRTWKAIWNKWKIAKEYLLCLYAGGMGYIYIYIYYSLSALLEPLRHTFRSPLKRYDFVVSADLDQTVLSSYTFIYLHLHIAFICNYMFNTTDISAYISTLCILNVSIRIRYLNVQLPLVYHNVNKWTISRRLGEFAEDTYDYLETQQRFQEACVLWYLDLICFDDIGCSRYSTVI